MRVVRPWDARPTAFVGHAAALRRCAARRAVMSTSGARAERLERAGESVSAGDDGTTDDFAEALLARVRQARADLADAAAHPEGTIVQIAMDELEDALAAARAHGVDVPPATVAHDDAADGERG
jgi:hypothetical protein